MTTTTIPARWRVGPTGVSSGELFRAVSDDDGVFVHWIPERLAEQIVKEHNALVALFDYTADGEPRDIAIRVRLALGLEPRAEGSKE